MAAKCVVITRAGMEPGDVETCRAPCVPDHKLRAGDLRFICQRHLDLTRAGHFDPYTAELVRPYDENAKAKEAV